MPPEPNTKPNPEPNRPEFDPLATTRPPAEGDVPPERPAQRKADDPSVGRDIDRLIEFVGGDPASTKGRMVREILVNGLKLIPDGRDTGEMKLMTAALKEMRYAYRIFGQYPTPHKVTIFGSARTPEGHPDYHAAVVFGRLMAAAGWMVITGAGDGIMRAGHEGPGREASFGVAIRLPFETTANKVIAGDEKLIHFRYFFTRKLMFISQAEAVACFPGGFGTMDEAYEVLTLVQTGKASMIPIVLIEGKDNPYWEEWDAWVRGGLLSRGLISPDDLNLYTIAQTPDEGVAQIVRFYRNYHSARYVRDDLVIRIRRPLAERDVEALSEEFAPLLKRGAIVQRGPMDVEEDHLDLPRLVFTHTRHRYGLVRQLIDRINGLEPA